jgi:drug/metabolite transporter (DMT)-like permease
MSDRTHARAVLAILGAAVLWSTGGLVIKLAPLGPLGVACGRALVTSVFYLLVLRPDLRKASLVTAAAYAGMILTFVSATKLTTAANAIFLQYTGPAYVLLLAPAILKERFRAVDAVCVAASLAGMSLFFVGKVEAGHAVGNLLGAASGLFFGFAILFLRRDAASGHGDALPSMTLGNLLAAGIALPFCASEFGHLTAVGLAALLYLGIVQMGVAYILFNKGLRRVPAAEASLLSMLEPTFNPIWVYLGTGERPAPLAILGGGIVIASVVLRTWLAPALPRAADEDPETAGGAR